MAISPNEYFASILQSIVVNCDEIDSFIQNTDYIVEKYKGKSVLHGNNSDTPLDYLGEQRWMSIWEDYFLYIMDQWQHGHVTVFKWDHLIEKLSAPAARLDKLVPKLERECQRMPNVPESVVKNVLEMQTCVNSFLNCADDGLNIWRRQREVLVESEVRKRRPIVRPILDPNELEAEEQSDEIKDDSKEDKPQISFVLHTLNSMLKTLTCNAGLLAVTGIVSTVSCIIQTRAFMESLQQQGRMKGSTNDPDFYNAIQTFMMQILALYTVLAPASNKEAQLQYGFWTWVLSILSLATGIASLVIYTSFTSLSPLLGCVSNALQAFVTLQLVLSVNSEHREIRKNETKKEV